MSRLARIAIGLLAASALAAAAQTPAVNLKQQRQYVKLSAQAAKQTGHKQAQTLAKLALLDYNFALAGFAANDNQRGLQDLAHASAHIDRACALLQAESARGKTDGMKNVEMAVQQMVFGLKGLAEQVDYTVRPKVQAVGSHFAALDSQILQWMFAPKRKH
jgi:hypothetical protein